jgi:CBS domain-containing protein
VAREIENQYSVEGLVPVAGRINGVITVLLKEGARASNITRIITEINDGLVRRILQIAEKKFGSPPVRYCWIVFGTDGRKEQTIRTDQDNAIIYEDPRSQDEGRRAAEYFEGFSIFVRDALVRCGFPPCPDNHMASNPEWRQPLGVWKEYFSRWILSPTLDNVLFSAVLFDFRPIFGEVHLAEKLRAYLLQTVRDHELFLKQMAEMTLRLRPPLGFFKTFILEKGGAHKDQLDLKFRCIMLLIDIVRLFSLEKGITETSTLGRIAALKGSHEAISEVGDELGQAFEFLMLLRIQHHFDQIEAGKELDNFVNPYNLTNLEKKTLKESCLLISRVQDMISREYRPESVV